jgi:hypothetical protein
VQQDRKANKESREIPETQALKVHRVTLARQEQLGLKLIRVILEPLAHLDRQGHKVRRAILVQLVPLALLAFKDSQEQPEPLLPLLVVCRTLMLARLIIHRLH